MRYEPGEAVVDAVSFWLDINVSIATWTTNTTYVI